MSSQKYPHDLPGVDTVHLKMRAISLAKETLVAWKALQAYFSASALRTSTSVISRLRNEKSP